MVQFLLNERNEEQETEFIVAVFDLKDKQELTNNFENELDGEHMELMEDKEYVIAVVQKEYGVGSVLIIEKDDINVNELLEDVKTNGVNTELDKYSINTHSDYWMY